MVHYLCKFLAFFKAIIAKITRKVKMEIGLKP